jgi:hypothetical protein
VKSERSMFCRIAFLSVSVFAVILAYKLGKEQSRTHTLPPSSPRNTVIALKEGQTIVGVVDTTKALRFYISNDGGNRANNAES